MTWENGRELATITNRSTGASIASYEYDASGLRISKTTTSGGNVYYVYDENSNLIFEKHSDYTLAFYYDGNGIRTHFTKKSDSGFETYYYRYNLQGDIIALLNNAGTVVAEYNYTAYGKPIGTVSEIGNLNPFRYRGYYYDTETGFYYLQSRYYDPYTCRFINADDALGANSDIFSYNLFLYCANDPVNKIDPEGNAWVYVWQKRTYTRIVTKTTGWGIFKRRKSYLELVTVYVRIKVYVQPKPKNPYYEGQNVAKNKSDFPDKILSSCSLYVQRRGKVLGYNMTGIRGNGNEIAKIGLANRKDLKGKLGTIKASDLRSNSILSFEYKWGSNKTYGHVIYIEFVDGNKIYYSEGGTSKNGVIKMKYASDLLKYNGINYGSTPVGILYL